MRPDHHLPSPASLRLLAAAVLALTGGLLAAPSASTAATYPVNACQHGNGAPAPADGWVGSNTGSYSYFQNNCATGGGLDTSWDAGTQHAYNDGARFTFTAPANTSIASLSLKRTLAAGPDRAYGSPTALIASNLGVLEQCSRYYGCTSLNGDASYPLAGATSVSVGITCGGGPEGSCSTGGQTNSSAQRIQVALNDDSAPSITQAPTGTLLSPTTTERARSLNFAASDVGGGVYLARLIADGTNTVYRDVVDPNGGRCDRSPGTFSYRVPCPLSAGGQINFDTSALPDGGHELLLDVRDVTDTNTTRNGPWRILVDNQPPVLDGPPTITGTARVGRLINCQKPGVDGQNPALSYQWIRTAPDGSARTPIDGATQPSYMLTPQDQGSKLLCVFTATDHGGPSSVESDRNNGPFAAQTVAPPAGGQGLGPGDDLALRGAPNGTPANDTAILKMSWSTKRFATVRTANYAGTKYLRGTLTTPDGQPIAGAVLDVAKRLLKSGAAAKPAKSVTTDAQGKFKVTFVRGPSYDVRASYRSHANDGITIATNTAQLRIRAQIKLNVTPRRYRRGSALKLRAQLYGGRLPGRGKQVAFQVRTANRWQTFTLARSNQRGTVRTSYRLRAASSPRYRFRAISRYESAYPFTTGRSPSITIRRR